MGPPPWFVRRFLLAPIAWAGSLALALAAPILLPVFLVADLVDRRAWRFTRLLGLGVTFCVLEFASLTAALGVWAGSGWSRDRRRRRYQTVLAWWLGKVTRAIRRCLNFTFDVRFPDTAGAPLVVLSRHAGPGDALFLMSELANGQGREIRAIGRHKLVWDPFFDIVAGGAGFEFPRPGDPAILDRVRSAAAIPGRGAFISFPEGGNFTTRRHGVAVSGLRESGHALADTAAGLRHLLLPRPGGVAAALAGAPTAAVVFVGHSGYDDIVGLADMWKAIPEGRRIRLEARVVPRPENWEDRETLRAWLLACWSDMDRWIRKHSGTAAAPRADSDAER